jgi:hypothetical protein
VSHNANWWRDPGEDRPDGSAETLEDQDVPAQGQGPQRGPGRRSEVVAGRLAPLHQTGAHLDGREWVALLNGAVDASYGFRPESARWSRL